MTTHEQEEEYLGEEFDQAPKVEPNDECNGRQMRRTDEGDRLFDGYCSLPAGWGVVEGGEEGRRCKLHGGTPSGGAPVNNQNATKHGLKADPHHYYQSLPPEGKAYVERLAESVEDRIQEEKGSLDYMDRLLSRQVAIQLHIASRASSYIKEESGLSQEVNEREESAPLIEEARQYVDAIFRDLNSLGVFDDTSESDSEDADSWRGFIEDGEAFESA